MDNPQRSIPQRDVCSTTNRDECSGVGVKRPPNGWHNPLIMKI